MAQSLEQQRLERALDTRGGQNYFRGTSEARQSMGGDCKEITRTYGQCDQESILQYASENCETKEEGGAGWYGSEETQETQET